MNYNEIVCEYIKKCNLDEPLFLEEIKQYVINKYKKEAVQTNCFFLVISLTCTSR